MGAGSFSATLGRWGEFLTLSGKNTDFCLLLPVIQPILDQIKIICVSLESMSYGLFYNFEKFERRKSRPAAAKTAPNYTGMES